MVYERQVNDGTTTVPEISFSISIKLIERQFGDVIRLAASIQQGTVTASLILRKLGSYPRQNSLALALREVGRIERTLFMLEWFRDPTLRRRVTAGLERAKHTTPWLGPSVSTDSAKSAIAPSRTSAIEPAG
jgi:TnpA family transposase